TFENGTPAEVLAKVNDLIVRLNTSSGFITVFFGVLDAEMGRLTYCSAGHPPQLIKLAAGGVKLLNTTSPIIGAFKGLQFSNEMEAFGKGDQLVLYTDGITEARRNADFFGEERLTKFVQDLKATSTEEIPSAVYNNVIGWSSGKLLDDVALFSVSIVSDSKQKKKMEKP
ncbi:MAG: serine/threonine-protein phosphatase, partial [Rubrobacteridae bacterium]|nr:serine/threonine-protein phosphatase [Rubrobacteridae bacterium]